MKKVIIILASFAILLLMCRFSYAQVYKWVDNKGGIHFTDNYYQIPERYRNQITSVKQANEPTNEPINEKILMEKMKENICGRCEISSFRQTYLDTGMRFQRGNLSIPINQTCAEIIIKNNSCESKTVTDKDILARFTGNEQVSPNNIFSTTLRPGQAHTEIICFGIKEGDIQDISLY